MANLLSHRMVTVFCLLFELCADSVEYADELSYMNGPTVRWSHLSLLGFGDLQGVV